MRKILLYILTILLMPTLILYGIENVQASPVVANHFETTGCTDITRTLVFTDPPMTGEDILELQQRLVELDYAVPVTGVYDKETASAIYKFKKNNQLEPTYEVGPLTWEKLGQGVQQSSSSNKIETPQPPVEILIEVAKQQLTVFSQGKKFHTFKIAVGKHKTPTPHGEFKIVSKGAWGGGFGTRWNGLNVPWGTFGIHGTNKPWSIGRYASHGCIRMFNKDVETLFPWVPIGTPVKLINENFGPPEKINNTIKMKSSGQIVVYIQEALKNKRFLIGMADGIYGSSTAVAVSYFQAYNNLPITGEVDAATYAALLEKEKK